MIKKREGGNSQRDSSGRWQHNGDPKVRFWSKVKKGPGCWEWIGGLGTDGYGAFWWDGKTSTAYRFSWIIAFGLPLPGMEILHQCDNVLCVRPDHLFLGTSKTNIRDRVSKGRSACGSSIGTSKFTVDDVIIIRELVAAGGTYAGIARSYKVTPRSIRLIALRETWSHV